MTPAVTTSTPNLSIIRFNRFMHVGELSKLWIIFAIYYVIGNGVVSYRKYLNNQVEIYLVFMEILFLFIVIIILVSISSISILRQFPWSSAIIFGLPIASYFTPYWRSFVEPQLGLALSSALLSTSVVFFPCGAISMLFLFSCKFSNTPSFDKASAFSGIPSIMSSIGRTRDLWRGLFVVTIGFFAFIVVIISAHHLHPSAKRGTMTILVGLMILSLLYCRSHLTKILTFESANPKDNLVLFLRSFKFDSRIEDISLSSVSDITAWKMPLYPFRVLFHSYRALESEVAPHFRALGTFISVDDPSGGSSFGSRKVRLDHDNWKHEIINAINRSERILMQFGPTESVKWELQQVIYRGFAGKLILILPKSTEEQYRLMVNNISHILDDTIWEKEFGEAVKIKSIIGIAFGVDGKICVISSRTRGIFMQAIASIMLEYQQRSVEGFGRYYFRPDEWDRPS